MSDAELGRGQAVWNPLIQHRVVYFRELFIEIRVLGNVRRSLDEFESYGITALTTEREYRVTKEEQRRPGLIRMTDLVNARLRHGLTRIQVAIGLIIHFSNSGLICHEYCTA